LDHWNGIWCGSTVLYNVVILFTDEDESNTEDEGLTDAAGQGVYWLVLEWSRKIEWILIDVEFC
jgi:hypothetical protein